ncbi:MFS transporter [Chloroflexota bacterium]
MLPLFILGHFAHHLLTALPVPLSPMIRSEFALNYTQVGLVISAFTLSNGIGQMPAGWIADHIGPRIVITMGICGVAVAGLLVGLSQTYVMMMVFLALMGVMAGGYHPAAPPLIAASVKPEHRGRALGLHIIGGSLSFFTAPLIASAITPIWGWRGAFIGLSVPAVIFGVIFYIILGRLMVSRKAKPGITGTQSEVPSTPGRLRRLTIFIILATATRAVVYSVMSFIPLFLVDKFSVAEETAARWIALIYFVGIFASPIGGYLSDRWGRVPLILATCFAVGPAIYLLNIAPYPWGIAIILLVIGIFIYVRMPVSEAYIVSHTSERNRSTVLGIFYFSGMEGGGILMPVIGYLADHIGVYLTFTIAGAVVVAVTAICSIWLWGKPD